jgi:predicted MPP superfamily phosphohydrolase
VWLIYVAVGFVLLFVGGFYVRRRVTQALTEVGVGPRGVRIFRWAAVWFLFFFPVAILVAVIIAILVGAEQLPRFEGPILSRIFGVPWLWAMLVMGQSLLWLVAIDIAHLFLKKARWRAIGVLAVVGVFAIYTPGRILWERGEVRLRHHSLGTGSAPFRIAVIADLQQDAFTDQDTANAIVARLNAEHPDVVLSGGDWINSGPDYIPAAGATAGTLKSRLGTYTVRGDHEHFAYIDRNRSVSEVEASMTKHGVAMLNNEIRWFDHAGKRIGVLFLNYNYVTRTPAPVVEAMLSQLARADYAILVTHQFDASLAALVKDKVDLVLGAHTHGGQVNPVIGLVHVRLARLETTHIDGRYQLSPRTTVIVTAGIGTSIIPVRYASPGSIEIVDVRL